MPQAGAKQILYDDVHRGRVSRNYTKTPNPRTAAQLGQRTRIALCAQAWRNLSAADAAAWRALATAINRTNALGYTYSLTGINVFYQVNIYRLLDAQAITTTPPPLSGIPPPLPMPQAIALFGPPAQIVIQITCPGFPDLSKLFGRLTPGSTNQARLRRPCEVRIASIDTSQSFSQVIAQFTNWAPMLDNITINNGDFIGAQFFAMSRYYLPRPALFIPLISVPYP